jgi:DedD protein
MVDTLVKERLTGAIILVALVVVLVPELLSGPIRPASRTHGPTSSAEEPPLRSYTINLADDAHGASGSLQPQPVRSPAAMAPSPEPAGIARAPPPATPAERTAPSARPIPESPGAALPAAAVAPGAASQPAAADNGAYVVQLGSFASRVNAERLAQQVHGQGFPVSVSRGSGGRRLYRVRVGPARDHAAAEQIAAKLRAQGHGGTVVPK